MIPDEVREAVYGLPFPGSWDEMVTLLTVDEDGHPHVCLLSRSELDADHERIHAVVAAPGTISHLLRTGAATLVFVLWDQAIFVKADVADVIEDDGWLGVSFVVRSVKRDSIGIPLEPPRYLVTHELAAMENWERSARLLERLSSTERTPS